jgi:tetratricopeptide (TPR) repeat protein
MSDGALHQAIALHQAGQLTEAERIYQAVLAAQPRNFNALHLLGVLRHRQGRPEEAVPLIEAALRIDVGSADAHGNLANALRSLGRLDEADARYRTALALAPEQAELHFGYAHVLRGLERYDEAAAHYQEAHRLRPDLPEGAIQLCNELEQQGRAETAEALLRTVIARNPGDAGAWLNLGLMLAQRLQVADAFECYARAKACAPDFTLAHYNEARLNLLTGNLLQGWAGYEWRHGLDNSDQLPPGFTQPRWTGEALDGGTLLLHGEQGFGDTLQFCRYLPLAARRARILLSVPAPLIRLLSSLEGVAEFVLPGRPVPHFDRYCALMSLPHLFGTTLSTIPARIPYLAADRDTVAAWRRRLAPLRGVRVGLVWAGGVRSDRPDLVRIDARRSMTLQHMAPLAQIAGVDFVSLQKGPPASQAAAPPSGLVLHDFTAELADFADTAALIETLDLVIGVDTAVVHLAGALGKPVWLLNRYDTCWRWLLDRDDSPWYPTLRQFRQQAPATWPEVIDAVVPALAAFVATRQR